MNDIKVKRFPSPYKYNIIDRLYELRGGEYNLKEKKKELIEWLVEKGHNVNTVRKWLRIEKGAKSEISYKALLDISSFFNKRYIKEQKTVWVGDGDLEIEKIEVNDLYNKGEL